ncbi:MAG TPA: phosphatase PAP2 family protein [Candidatus Dormibacteraeota bacterium]|jgi:membrane-associated phospholipid phosphatase|nr:phosphatase PAP2 family protein [Candidatus Dormibacteraeota bacterium]
MSHRVEEKKRIAVLLEPRPILAKLRQNIFLLSLGGYIAILAGWYAYNGVLFQFSLGLWALALLPLTLMLGRSSQFLKELTPFLVLLLSYEALQGVAGSLALTPVIHPTATSSVIAYDGFYQDVQSSLLSPKLTDVMTFMYGLHFPLIMAAAVTLWYSNKILYKGYVYSLIACSYVSLMLYIIAPSAPPWYNGIVTNLLANASAQTGSPGIVGEMARIGSLIESDKLAAFPSLHAAYVVLFGYFMVKLKKIFALFSIPIVAGVLFSTIYLGQHYLADLVSGISIAAVCALGATRLIRKQRASADHGSMVLRSVTTPTL